MRLQDFASFLPHSDQDIRTTLDDSGDIWFALNDVCAALNIGSPGVVARRLEPDERAMRPMLTPKGTSMPMWTVSEPGLYAVVIGMRGPAGVQARKTIARTMAAADLPLPFLTTPADV
jgi:prophage antirepressor-like protein